MDNLVSCLDKPSTQSLACVSKGFYKEMSARNLFFNFEHKDAKIRLEEKQVMSI